MLKEGAWGGMDVLANSDEISEDGKRKGEVGNVRNLSGRARFNMTMGMMKLSDMTCDHDRRTARNGIQGHNCVRSYKPQMKNWTKV